MLSNAKKVMLVIAMAIVGFVATNTAALAQPCSCNIVNGCKVLTYYDAAGNVTGTETICPSTGTGTFSCQFIENIPATGPLNVTVAPEGLNSTTISPTLGPITTNFDPTRTATPATIVSIDGVNRFPANVTFSFYVTADVNGRTYCSREQLVFNGIVNSFQPFRNELFRLQRDVAFYDCNDAAQTTVFVLNAGSFVNLN
jgi:hypothetical protein